VPARGHDIYYHQDFDEMNQDVLSAAGHATGLVATLLLTATVVLGAMHSGRASSASWPRFALHAVHRNMSLLALTFVLGHVVIATKAHSELAWLNAVLPYSSAPHPFWLGTGAVALDLMFAAIITSVLRVRIGLPSWRIVHVVAYASWPLALAHGLGIGVADRRISWVLAVYIGCVVAVAAAITHRLLAADPDRDARRAAQAGQR
jgi:predicted ferric reductase